MVQGKETAIQRIQVGLTGLVVVLLFVSLANMLLDHAAETAGAGADPALVEAAQKNDNTPGEPLAELGAAPVVESDATTGKKDNGRASGAASTANNRRPANPQ